MKFTIAYYGGVSRVILISYLALAFDSVLDSTILIIYSPKLLSPLPSFYPIVDKTKQGEAKD